MSRRNKISTENFKKEPIISKNKTLEIIFDNCSSGRAILSILEKISEFAELGPVFDTTRYVIPLQIGTEARRRLFKDFLESALENPNKNNPVHQFFQNNRNKIEIVETDISNAYRFFYADKAFKEIGRNEEMIDNIVAATQKSTPFEISNKDIKKEFFKFKELTEDLYGVYRANYKKTSRDISGLAGSIPVFQDLEKGDLKDLLKEVEKKIFARAGKELIKQAGDISRYILQSMYSDDKLHKLVNEHGKLKKYRKDKGERAIEDYLQNHRDKKDEGVVTIVVSADAKAIKRISDLRRKTHNIIIALGEDELFALSERLGIENGNNRMQHKFNTEDLTEDQVRFIDRAAKVLTTGTYKARGADRNNFERY